MTKSIIQTDMNICFICGGRASERHHALYGKFRRKSEMYGLVVGLCPACHRGTEGVHGRDGAKVNLFIKKAAQRAFEREYSHETFMAEFGKNYL